MMPTTKIFFRSPLLRTRIKATTIPPIDPIVIPTTGAEKKDDASAEDCVGVGWSVGADVGVELGDCVGDGTGVGEGLAYGDGDGLGVGDKLGEGVGVGRSSVAVAYFKS